MTELARAEPRIETAILIDAPIDLVWNILVDYESYGHWNPYIIRIDGVAQAGGTIDVHSIMSAQAAPIIAPVTVISLDRYIMHWEGGLLDRSAFKGDHFFALEMLDSGSTRLLHYEDFTGTQTEAILKAYQTVIEANFVVFNQALKTRAEKPL